MSLFNFGRKIEAAKEYSLADIPVFSSLTPTEQKLIEKKARIVEYKRGDIVYEENTPSDALYVVVSGRFRLYLKAQNASTEKTVVYFYRGDYFGEASLLTGRRHSSTVEAKRDGLILRIEKEDFLHLIKEIPSISQHLNRSMGNRLGKIESGNRNEIRVAALYETFDSLPGFQFWMDMAKQVARETKRKVIIVDLVLKVQSFVGEELQSGTVRSFDLGKHEPNSDQDLKSSVFIHPDGYSYLHIIHDEDKSKDDKRLSALMTFLTFRYDYLLIRMPVSISDVRFRVIKQADTVYVYAGGRISDLQEAADAIKEFTQNFAFTKNELRILLPDDQDRNGETLQKKEEIIGARVSALLPPKEKQLERYESTVRYLAKEFTGRLLGLALGSGAAYGLAHIGVLKVLEREGIIPDIVAGSSIGALVGGIWGAGFDSLALEKIAQSIDKKTGFFRLLGFQDMSIAHRGFFKGNQLIRFFDHYLEGKTFQDMKVPVKIVAANVFTSEEVVMDTGKVSEAIRASVSIPGIFRPFFWKGMQLIDGGVVDPLPVELLHGMGVKKVIAVNVLPGPKDRIERNRIREEDTQRKMREAAESNPFRKFFNRSVDKVYNRYAVNVFNVIMNTIQFLEYEIAQTSGRQADVMIHAIVRDAHWAEFYSPDKFIKVGEEKALEHLEEIKKLISES